MKIVVWFSCGAASAVAAYLTLRDYGHHNVVIVNNPIQKEHEDNKRFLKDVEDWLGVKIESAVNEQYPNASCVEVWEKRKFMSSPNGAPCTVELKKKARQQWEDKNNPDYHVLGFTFEEQNRAKRFRSGERENSFFPLIDNKMTKADCYMFLQEHGIKIPEIYKMGYPNANCIGCVKATSPTYWNHVRKMHPKQFEERAIQSRKIGAKLARHKGKRIFLDELPEDAVVMPLKNMDFECGIFCEEK